MPGWIYFDLNAYQNLPLCHAFTLRHARALPPFINISTLSFRRKTLCSFEGDTCSWNAIKMDSELFTYLPIGKSKYNLLQQVRRLMNFVPAKSTRNQAEYSVWHFWAFTCFYDGIAPSSCFRLPTLVGCHESVSPGVMFSILNGKNQTTIRLRGVEQRTSSGNFKKSICFHQYRNDYSAPLNNW